MFTFLRGERKIRIPIGIAIAIKAKIFDKELDNFRGAEEEEWKKENYQRRKYSEMNGQKIVVVGLCKNLCS